MPPLREEQLVRDDRLALLLKIVGAAIFLAIVGSYVLSVIELLDESPTQGAVELIDDNAHRIARLEERIARLEDRMAGADR